MSKPNRAAKTARASQRVALLRVAALETELARAAEGSEEAARLRAQVWAVREIAGLPH